MIDETKLNEIKNSGAWINIPAKIRTNNGESIFEELIRLAELGLWAENHGIKALQKYANPDTHSMDDEGYVWLGDYFDYTTATKALEKLPK